MNDTDKPPAGIVTINGNESRAELDDAVSRAMDESIAPPPFSDDALALGFSRATTPDWVYTAAWGQWHYFSGTHYKVDDTRKIYDIARLECRAASLSGELTKKDARAIASKATISAVEFLARASRLHAAHPDQWDRDPMLLCTPGGVIDLRSGVSRPARRADFMTKITACGASVVDTPMWTSFLTRITGGDAEQIRFLQRIAGYCLTGTIEEHALFFMFGKGANGKSVFLNTLAAVMGDYAMTASIETFTVSNNDRHPTELASLRGARLVTATETEEGRRWAESRICALTGGDKIAARFMRQDFFEFGPTFKIMIAGNYKPSLRGVGEAMRRRLNLIPFTVTIPEEERDEKLPERLKAEWSGILQWMIDGCVDWQGEGLAKPDAVRRATDEYFEAEDALGNWIGERCVVAPDASAPGSGLFNSWRKWADANGEFSGSQKRFSQALLDRGFHQQKSHGQRLFRGIRPNVEHAGAEGADD
jgi:putative DNA primase/helicase